MKIYFAGSIRGGRQQADAYRQLIRFLGGICEVLTEHVSYTDLSSLGEADMSEEEIYTRDMTWIAACDALVAEVTQPSLGVGYEVAVAEAAGKPVLAVHHAAGDHRLSAMISGNPNVQVQCYESIQQAQAVIRAFIADLQVHAGPVDAEDEMR